MEFFATRKADISIVEMMDQIDRDLDPVTKNDMKCQMKAHGVHQLTKTALLEVKEHSFLVKGSEGASVRTSFRLWIRMSGNES